MRPTYRATFNLGASGSEAPAFDQVLAECQSWASSPRAYVDPSAITKIDFSTSGHFEIGTRASMDVLRDSSPKLELFSFRLEHPDQSQEDARWRSEVCLAHDLERRSMRATMSISVGRHGSVVPLSAGPGRPRLVKNLVARFGAHDVHPITLTPRRIALTDVRSLVDFLFDSTRTLPVVFISARNWDDLPPVDPRVMADRLVALAHVAVGANRWPSFELRDALGRDLRCFDGAVRVYWPGLTPTSDPYEHPLITPRGMQESERRGGLAVELLARLSRSAVNRVLGTLDTWEGVERHVAAAKLDVLRAKADDSELAGLYARNNEELKQQVVTLTEELHATRNAMEAAERREQSWKDAYLELQRGPTDSGQLEPSSESAPPTTIEAALARVMSQHPGRLVNRLNSRSSLRDCLYEDVDGFYRACLFLATKYHDARTGVAPCSDLDLTCRTDAGFSYSAGQSTATMGKYEDYYEAKWNDRTVKLREHLKKGDDRDPRYAIRIAFHWDRESKVVVVGFIGQHQRNTAT